MSFVQGGGLFIRVKPTETLTMKLGDTVSLELTLPNDSMTYKISGKVIWITPTGAQGARPAGYGISLAGEGGSALNKRVLKQIDTLLKNPELPTDTM
jgi:type IV pilus assembly protein PilZ